MPEQEIFDTIIVGAGRGLRPGEPALSRSFTGYVLLLEAGPDHGADAALWPAEMRDPLSVAVESHSWGFGQPRGDSPDTINLARARVVGGTTTINGCLWIRGSAADYDGWEALGNPGWGFADLLPYFKRAESDPAGGPCTAPRGRCRFIVLPTRI